MPLDLPNWDIIERSRNEEEHTFHIRYVVEPSFCPRCGHMLPRLRKFGKKVQEFRDLPIHGQWVRLLVHRGRFQCMECHKTFYQDLPDLDEKRRMTKRAVEYVRRKGLEPNRTFVALAEEICVHEKTIRNIISNMLKELEANFRFVVPRWMGIDEVHIDHRARCVITNIEERTVCDILRDRKQATVTRLLSTIDNRKAVQIVTMDMWAPYRDAVRATLPNATIVIDKYHVVRMANQSLDRVRKSLRANMTDRQRRTLMHDRFLLLRRKKDLNAMERTRLDAWLNNLPDLRAAYDFKEDFFEIWNKANSSAEAKREYKKLIADLPGQLDWAFEDLVTALTNWEKEIFAYFDLESHPTNAYTESFNNLVRWVNRQGRGYSFRIIRAKLVFGQKQRKTYRTRVLREHAAFFERAALSDHPTFTYGADMDELQHDDETNQDTNNSTIST